MVSCVLHFLLLLGPLWHLADCLLMIIEGFYRADLSLKHIEVYGLLRLMKRGFINSVNWLPGLAISNRWKLVLIGVDGLELLVLEPCFITRVIIIVIKGRHAWCLGDGGFWLERVRHVELVVYFPCLAHLFC